jgi:hypothetical protein
MESSSLIQVSISDTSSRLFSLAIVIDAEFVLVFVAVFISDFVRLLRAPGGTALLTNFSGIPENEGIGVGMPLIAGFSGVRGRSVVVGLDSWEVERLVTLCAIPFLLS